MLVPGRQQPGLCNGSAAGITLAADSCADSVLSSCDLGKFLAEETVLCAAFFGWMWWLDYSVGPPQLCCCVP